MKRNDLLELMPKNKSDAIAADRIVQLGYPIIKPVLRDMLLWLRVAESEVADIFCAFFSNLKPPMIDLIEKHIGTTSTILRNRILVDILPNWPSESICMLKVKLTGFATHPDILNNDIECFKLIVRHGLAETTWVKGWLEMRKQQAQERVEFIAEIEEELETTF